MTITRTYFGPTSTPGTGTTSTSNSVSVQSGDLLIAWATTVGGGFPPAVPTFSDNGASTPSWASLLDADANGEAVGIASGVCAISASETVAVTATWSTTVSQPLIFVARLRPTGALSVSSTYVAEEPNGGDGIITAGNVTLSASQYAIQVVIGQEAWWPIISSGDFTAVTDGLDYLAGMERASSGTVSTSANNQQGSGRMAMTGYVVSEAGAPTAPTGVTAGSITALSATASWTDNSSDETGFKVEYAPSPYSSWTTLAGSPTAANATSLATGNVLTDGTSYKFRVASTNANGDSAWVESNEFTTVGVGSGRMLLLGVG
jgi:hypothetical protein